MINVGINGFGRIGKYLTRLLLEQEGIRITAINDLADINTHAHLFKYDSVHGKFNGEVSVDGDKLILNGQVIQFTSERSPEHINWPEGTSIVVEASGQFTKHEDAIKHLNHGVGKVLISAPTPSDEVKTILFGINDDKLSSEDLVVSSASCTTNSAGPLIQILDEHCGIESAYITTIHSYTGDQRIHDSPHKDLRRARAGALSIIPTSTGAAKAITKIFPHLKGKIGGSGIRVPTPNGSLTEISCVVKNPLSSTEINTLFRENARGKLKGILEYTDEPIVSVDIIGNPNSCIFDSQLTAVIGKQIKVVGWYDNEAGYSNRLLDLLKKMGA